MVAEIASDVSVVVDSMEEEAVAAMEISMMVPEEAVADLVTVQA